MARTNEARVVDIGVDSGEGVLQLLGVAHALHLGVIVAVPAGPKEKHDCSVRKKKKKKKEERRRKKKKKKK